MFRYMMKTYSSNTSLGKRYFWPKKKPNFGKYKLVEVAEVSKKRKPIPDHITKPEYYETGEPCFTPETPEIKSSQQISKMRDSCKLAANVLKAVGQQLKPGMTTEEVDTFVHNLTTKYGAYPSPLNYKGFPKSVCTSVNNVACHGIPDCRPLCDGDIINIDITVFYNGFHGDCSKTFMVGNVDDVGKDLICATETCVNEAIAKICKPGNSFWFIGEFIEKKAKELGFNVVPAFIGHGIGEYFHGPPDIYHISNYYPGKMEPGMTFTVEPVLTCGSQEIEILEDGWTAVTLDFSRTAQYEHTVLITKDGAEKLTVPD